MLVLSRKCNERIVVDLNGETVTIEVLQVKGGRVRVGIDAPSAIVNGIPIPNNRTGKVNPRRNARKSMRAASPNNTNTNVSSAIRCTGRSS